MISRGEKFGRWTVLGEAGKDKRQECLWECRCDCGNIRIVQSHHLRSGHSKSCGCLNIEKTIERSWKGGKIKVHCAYCGNEKEVFPVKTKDRKYHFCNRSCQSKWQSENQIGKKNVRWRPKVEVFCSYCGKVKEINQNFFDLSQHFFCNKSCQNKWQVGKNASNWQGGKSIEPYCPIWNYKDFRNGILSRDNHKCQNPDCWGKIDRLSIHHIDFDKTNCSPNNLITLCTSCNARANFDREWHTAWYNALMQRSNKVINNLNHTKGV